MLSQKSLAVVTQTTSSINSPLEQWLLYSQQAHCPAFPYSAAVRTRCVLPVEHSTTSNSLSMVSNAIITGKLPRLNITPSTNLFSVKFDSINQLELDLLKTAVVADGNENVDMSDDLLEQEIEELRLSQPRQPPLLQGVPYKEVDDFQTSKGQKSVQLSIKDLNLSTPISTLVIDGTQLSPIHWDDENPHIPGRWT